MNNNRHTGRVGELFAQSVLEAHDIRTSHVDIEGDDLWTKTPNGQFFKVQVKSASKPLLHSSHHTIEKYNFALHRMSQYEGIVLLVALDVKLLIARRGELIRSKTIKLRPDAFTQEAQDASLRECFEL